MIRYLLDTNVVSELRKPKPHGAVVAWLQSLRENQIYISAVTLGELQRGIERTRKQDADKAREIQAWLDQVEASQNLLLDRKRTRLNSSDRCISHADFCLKKKKKDKKKIN